MKLAAVVTIISLLVAPLAVAEMSIDSAWVRAAPPGLKMTAAYATVTNDFSDAMTIIGVSTSIARVAELHTTVQNNGMSFMSPLASVELAPGESFSFVPGGPHIMLMDVASMPPEGSGVELCFEVAAGDRLCTTAIVSRGLPQTSIHEGEHGGAGKSTTRNTHVDS